jgi:L-Ala-D/L-Glu epimerase
MTAQQLVAVELRAVRWHQQPSGPAIWRALPPREGLLVRVVDGEGMDGLGEASPLAMSEDEEGAHSLAGVTAALQQWAKSVADRAVVVRAPDDAARVAAEACAHAPAARFALETALLDVLAKKRGVSLAEQLAGGDAMARSVPINAVVDSVEAAQAAWARGVATLKLKLGLDTDADARLLRAIRQRLASPGLRLRGDANQGWPLAEVRERLAALASVELDYVEEPCRDLQALLDSSSAWPAELPPLAIDESAAQLGDQEVRGLLAHPRVAALIAKPTRLGGLSVCQRWAPLAARSGKRMIVTHTLEGPIAMAACAELARALAPAQPETAVGLDGHPGLAAWPLRVPQLTSRAIEAQAQPGLAITTPWSQIIAQLGSSSDPS